MPDNRLPCRDDYAALETQLQALTTQITAIYQLLADLGLATLAPISQDDYDHLSPTEQLAGCFDIYDALQLDIDGNKVLYSSNPKVSVNDMIGKIKKETITGTTNSYGMIVSTIDSTDKVLIGTGVIYGAIIFTTNSSQNKFVFKVVDDINLSAKTNTQVSFDIMYYSLN